MPANGRWLAAGFQDDGDTYDGALWESADGAQWQRLPTDRLFQGELDTAFGRLYPTPDGVLLIGNEGPHEERVQCEQLIGQESGERHEQQQDDGLFVGHGWLPQDDRDAAYATTWS
ncbi:MAG: hypothetical protein Q7S35_03915 [Candidatus Limnocylindrales bacterium]|nr:hypothetical protein [Candidatus Limnocylindrales bacterium]